MLMQHVELQFILIGYEVVQKSVWWILRVLLLVVAYVDAKSDTNSDTALGLGPSGVVTGCVN